MTKNTVHLENKAHRLNYLCRKMKRILIQKQVQGTFNNLLANVKAKVKLRLSVSQSVSLGVESHLGLMTRYLLLFDSYGLASMGLDESMGLSFVYAAGTRQRSLSWVRVPWDSWPYFTVSDLKLPFSSPPKTHRATVEVFDPASTWVSLLSFHYVLNIWYDTDRIESTTYNNDVGSACSLISQWMLYTDWITNLINKLKRQRSVSWDEWLGHCRVHQTVVKTWNRSLIYSIQFPGAVPLPSIMQHT
jgi:hypothetical protein